MSIEMVLTLLLLVSTLLNIWWGRAWWGHKTKRWRKAWYIARD